MHRKSNMKIKSVVSIVARAESAKDRQAAIRNSWPISEAEYRRRIAIDAQALLASSISSELLLLAPIGFQNRRCDLALSHA